MADEENENVIKKLTEELESSLKTEHLDVESVNPTPEEHVEDHEFHDAASSLGDSSESDDQSDLDEPELTEEEIQEGRRKALELKEQGNDLFRNGEHKKACKLYSKALKSCHKSLTVERAMLYNNRAAARTKQCEKEKAVIDCTKAIELNPPYVKALQRRAKLHEELDQLDRALEDYKELNKLEPNNPEAKAALITLPKRIEEQTEKLKKEMFGKMKDLGNMILKPFGLSTDNFQITQDPATGSYSVNMTK